METLIVYPKNVDKLKSIKAVLKALEIDFEENPYDPVFVAKIKQGDEDIKNGKGIKTALNDI